MDDRTNSQNAASFLGETVPAGDAPGASPSGAGARVLAAAVHLIVVAAITLEITFIPFSSQAGERLSVGIFLTIVALILLVILWFATRGMMSEVSHHAAQAVWWLVLAFGGLMVAALIAAFLPFALGYPLFVIAAVAAAAPAAMAAYRVFTGMGHRYPFVAARMEAGRR